MITGLTQSSLWCFILRIRWVYYAWGSLAFEKSISPVNDDYYEVEGKGGAVGLTESEAAATSGLEKQ